MGIRLPTFTISETSGNHAWIRPLLARLGLLQPNAEVLDPAKLWDELEQSTFLPRLREAARLINSEAGYQLMHIQWFLPPQRIVCTFSVKKEKADFKMQLVLRQAGPTMIFYSRGPGSGVNYSRLYRYLAGDTSGNVRLRRVLLPADVTDKDLQEWFTYLLSGFQETFTPAVTKGI
jgi:hypothetical protein